MLSVGQLEWGLGKLQAFDRTRRREKEVLGRPSTYVTTVIS